MDYSGGCHTNGPIPDIIYVERDLGKYSRNVTKIEALLLFVN